MKMPKNIFEEHGIMTHNPSWLCQLSHSDPAFNNMLHVYLGGMCSG